MLSFLFENNLCSCILVCFVIIFNYVVMHLSSVKIGSGIIVPFIWVISWFGSSEEMQASGEAISCCSSWKIGAAQHGRREYVVLCCLLWCCGGCATSWLENMLESVFIGSLVGFVLLLCCLFVVALHLITCCLCCCCPCCVVVLVVVLMFEYRYKTHKWWYYRPCS